MGEKAKTFLTAIFGGLVVLAGQQAIQRAPSAYKYIKEKYQKPEVSAWYENKIEVKDNDLKGLTARVEARNLVIPELFPNYRDESRVFFDIPPEIMKRNSLTFIVTDSDKNSEAYTFEIKDGALHLK